MRIELPNAKQLKGAKLFTDEALNDLIKGQEQIIKQVIHIRFIYNTLYYILTNLVSKRMEQSSDLLSFMIEFKHLLVRLRLSFKH
jgi:hypothetical protein